MSVLLPAVVADASKKSLADCTTFDQADKGEDAVQFTVKNTCSIPVDCTFSWRVVCAPQSKKRRSVHAGDAKVSLVADTGSSTKDVSAAVCGDDSFSIEGIEWSCAANND
ncbi:MAG: hypothetical protein ABI591_29340 [Kofleriaceae bacterium]